jgi:uncharacterized protein YcbX
VPRTVSAIATTPVKGFALTFPARVTIGASGVDDDRRFALLDANGERLRSRKHAWPCTVAARYDAESRRLGMRFPDGSELARRVETGALVRFDYHGESSSTRTSSSGRGLSGCRRLRGCRFSS